MSQLVEQILECELCKSIYDVQYSEGYIYCQECLDVQIILEEVEQ